MKRNKEEVPGFDEIIFENRNKEYGAFVIRKKYLPTTFWSTIGGCALFIAVVIFSAMASNTKATATGPEIINVLIQTDSTLLMVNKLREEAPKPPDEIKVKRYTAPEIVEKLDSNDFTLMAVVNLDTMKQLPPDDLVINEVENAIIPVTEPPIPVVIEEMPVFPGGNQAMMKFINDNIKYPSEAEENGIQGRITLKFVVWKDGSVRMAEIVKGVDPLLDNEAIRVISMLPKWKPGRQNGEFAAVWYTVPVTFRIENR